MTAGDIQSIIYIQLAIWLELFKCRISTTVSASDFHSENVSSILIFCSNILRGRAEVARQAHNLKVGGSNPPPATNYMLVSANG